MVKAILLAIERTCDGFYKKSVPSAAYLPNYGDTYVGARIPMQVEAPKRLLYGVRLHFEDNKGYIPRASGSSAKDIGPREKKTSPLYQDEAAIGARILHISLHSISRLSIDTCTNNTL